MVVHSLAANGDASYGYDHKVHVYWGNAPFTLYSFDNSVCPCGMARGSPSL